MQAEHEAAVQAEHEAAPRPLPPFDAVSRTGGWTAAVPRWTCPPSAPFWGRLSYRVVPVRTGWGEYAADVTWTPTGEALRR